ncbi:MAG: AmmeMemoRadiSam system protein B [Desulfobacterales bacterium]|nr:AmmeMemoRadiSam system protein B [Desulfobacterales bacterium]
MRVRPAMFAGSWYPSSPSACENEIHAFLEQPGMEAVSPRYFLGGIVPHAGWFFSGAIACNVIHLLARGEMPEVVWLFGMHLHQRSPAYIMTQGAWETPFGNLEIDSACAEELSGRFDFQIETVDDFTPDNTIELQLPFVKYFFPETKIVPVGPPPTPKAMEVGAAAAQISKKHGRRVRVIGSTDLTHYGPNYGFTPQGKGKEAVAWVKGENDRRMVEALTALEPKRVIEEALSHQNACCAGAAAAAISAGKALGEDSAEMVAYATSYDKNPGDSLVGYTGIVF